MNAIYLALVSLLGFVVSYFVYGRFIGIKILELDPRRKTPAHIKEDGSDYVPTNRFVLFGHHFASIAGLGPILGPAIAVIWGWLPALLWVVFGTILLGAVHDLVALGISLRFEGRSIGDVTKDIIGPRARILFLLIIFFALALAMGVFALVIAVLFTSFQPQAVIPIFSLIFVAVLMGVAVYKFKVPLLPATVVGLVVVFIGLFLGVAYPVSIYQYFTGDKVEQALAKHREAGHFEKYVYVVSFGESDLDKVHGDKALGKNVYPRELVEETNRALVAGEKVPIAAKPLIEENVLTMMQFFKGMGNGEVTKELAAAGGASREVWIYLLLFYALVASVLPVWLLLQPRDYLNSFQLYLGGGLMYLGMFLMAPLVVAPAVNPAGNYFTASQTLPAMFPFLFITIACGAISGFHCLVSSGTTVRQLEREQDAIFIGYGGMLTEGALAVIVILACTAGFSSEHHWSTFYSSWAAAGSLPAKMAAFINGAGVFVSQVGIPLAFAKTLIAVVVVGFAMTTLDSATRLLRYNVEELANNAHIKVLANKYLASFIAVVVIAFFALLKIDGKPAGMILWALFGSTNQLLGAIALLVGSIYLYKKGKPVIYTFLPMVFMLIVTLSAMSVSWVGFIQAEKPNIPLVVVGGVLMVMTIWLCVEAFLAFSAFRSGKAPDMNEPEPSYHDEINMEAEMAKDSPDGITGIG